MPLKHFSRKFFWLYFPWLMGFIPTLLLWIFSFLFNRVSYPPHWIGFVISSPQSFRDFIIFSFVSGACGVFVQAYFLDKK